MKIFSLLFVLLFLVNCQTSIQLTKTCNLNNQIYYPKHITTNQNTSFHAYADTIKFEYLDPFNLNPSGGSYEVTKLAYQPYKFIFKTETPGDWKITTYFKGKVSEDYFTIYNF